MKPSIPSRFRVFLGSTRQWYFETPERSLDLAYQAALTIKAMEDEHFDGKKVSAQSKYYGDSVMAMFRDDLNKHLKTIKYRLSEFQSSRSVVDFIQTNFRNSFGDSPSRSLTVIHDNSDVIIEKLTFIDAIITRYTPQKEKKETIINPNTALAPITVSPPAIKTNQPNPPPALAQVREDFYDSDTDSKVESIADQTGVLPRSILRTIDRLKRDLDPNAEREVVRNFRNSQSKTYVSMQFLLFLIVVPLIAQLISKNFVVGPFIDRVRDNSQVQIFLNQEMQEEAFLELERFESQLKFNALIGLTPEISNEVKEEKVKERAKELEGEYRQESANAIKNWCADLISLVVFGWIIYISKRKIAILKSFIDDVVYGLSDSAKAFIIILFTDIFVGFHSPHGWEILLEGVSRHLGLPENHSFIFLFIATFPVILDTIFKYWIFRYLNRISPSAVATYKNMNE